MEGEDSQNKKTQRLTIWAVIMITIGITALAVFDLEQAKELFVFLMHIITHLIAG